MWNKFYDVKRRETNEDLQIVNVIDSKSNDIEFDQKKKIAVREKK